MSRRLKLAGAAFAALVVALGFVAVLAPKWLGMSSTPLAVNIGGPFKLRTHDGKVLSDRDLLGRPYAVFFGFTNCPDVCPTTMMELANAMETLGPDADKMSYLFVSVDPEQDTAEHLSVYVQNFDKRLVGLIGTAEEIADVARKFRVFYEKVKTKEGYTINHTATTYLMDRRGKFFGTISYQENPKTRIEKLRRLIASP